MRMRIASVALLCTAAAPSSWRAAELGRSSDSQWATAQTLVYHDAAAFQSAWNQLYPNANRRPARPAIDFSQWRVIVVTAGQEPSGGYQLGLVDGKANGDSAIITVQLTTPPRGCGMTEQLTHPAVAIAVPTAPGPFRIVHRERADTVRCH